MKFEAEIKGTSLILTGEGKLDQQTLSGKVINGVCQVAQKQQIPVIALCGSLALSPSEMDELNLLGAFTIVHGPCSLETAMENVPK
jgi:glycerate kinase